MAALAEKAGATLQQAPFPQITANAPTERERTLRRYLAAFGISSPARLQQDRSKTDAVLAETLLEITRARPRATRVCLCSPSPDASTLATLREALARLRRHHIQLTWLPSAYEPALALLGNPTSQDSNAESLRTVSHAVRLRMRVLARQGDSALQRLGVKLYRAKRHSLPPPRPGAKSD
jgi:hypothetical protein